MNELLDFLNARLDEDEQTARACPQSRWEVSGPPPGHYAYSATSSDLVGWTGPNSRAILANPTFRAEGTLAHAARHDPARELREVEAKRWIIAEHKAFDLNGWDVPACIACNVTAPCNTLRALALPYADHPDYCEDWKL